MHADANSNSFFAQGGYNYPSACSSHRPATKTLLGFTVYIRLRTPHLFCNFASCRRHRKSRVNQLIMHLCIADLIVTFVMLPLEIGWHATVGWKAGNIACKVFTFFRSVNSLLACPCFGLRWMACPHAPTRFALACCVAHCPTQEKCIIGPIGQCRKTNGIIFLRSPISAVKKQRASIGQCNKHNATNQRRKHWCEKASNKGIRGL